MKIITAEDLGSIINKKRKADGLTLEEAADSCQWKVASYSVARDTWIATAWSYPVVNDLLSGDQTLVGTVAANATGKALATRLSS
jgi:hypothetical protein